MIDKIIEKIKEANEASSTVIADDESNEIISAILAEFNIDDNESELTERYGQDGYEKIRDAENGFY